MANTMTKIATQTITGSTTNSFIFSYIPQTYTDLVIKVSARSTYASTSNTLFMTTQDGGTNTYYSQTYLYGNGSGAASSRNATGGSEYGMQIFETPGTSITSNVFNSVDIYIPNYATTTAFKQIIIDGVAENNATANYYNMLHANLWSSTSAITSLQFYLQFGTTYFVPGSKFTLYGI